MQISESVRMALFALRTNKLRAGLTLLSIAIGVFAIVGVAAAVGALDATVEDQMESLGRNSFLIQRFPAVSFGDNRRYRNRQPITIRQAMQFKERMTGATDIGMWTFNGGAVVQSTFGKTDPDIMIYGGDEAFLVNNDYEVAEGRSLDAQDVQLGADVAVLGASVANEVFPNVSGVGSSIKIKGHRYTVIGVLQAKGSVFGQDQDGYVLVPITSASQHFFDEWLTSVSMLVRSTSMETLPEAMDQATGLMRIIRGVRLGEENDFEVESNEQVGDVFGSFTQYLTWFGLISGGMALLAAGIGIMNIMLVSVKERTREIGVRKAVGARRRDILVQFIIESITLAQVGAIIGVVLGIGVGAAAGLAMGVGIPIPWAWVGVAVGVCLIVGVVFGAYPAWRAARLDPIDALRYE